MERINPASLKRRLLFQSLPAVPDASGDAGATNWVDGVTIWGSVMPVSAGEIRAGLSAQHEISHRIIIRYRTGITSGMRAKLGTRVFDLTGVRDIEDRQEFLEITALEGKPHV